MAAKDEQGKQQISWLQKISKIFLTRRGKYSQEDVNVQEMSVGRTKKINPIKAI